jgi:hypothetical protein
MVFQSWFEQMTLSIPKMANGQLNVIDRIILQEDQTNGQQV